MQVILDQSQRKIKQNQDNPGYFQHLIENCYEMFESTVDQSQGKVKQNQSKPGYFQHSVVVR